MQLMLQNLLMVCSIVLGRHVVHQRSSAAPQQRTNKNK